VARFESDRRGKDERERSDRRSGGSPSSNRDERPPRTRRGTAVEAPTSKATGAVATDGRLIMGKEAVRAVFAAGIRRPRTITLASGDRPELAEFLTLARKANVSTREMPYGVITERAGSDGHQGVLLTADPLPMHSLAELAEKPNAPILLLDHIEDPHNLGACLRVAAEMGAAGVVFPKVRSAPLSPSALKAAAGAAEYIPLACEANMAMAIRRLRDAGRWIIGAAPDAATPSWDAAWQHDVVIVIGGESHGISRLVAELCDELVSLPSKVGLTLNASVAAALLVYEATRKR
jgi:23S rRNA (guanosine2251-2'-O)-methyltransferase